MATAKLWWNGSSWRTSSAYCVNDSSDTGSSYAYVRYRIQVMAFDDLSIRMTADLSALPGTVSGNAWLTGDASDTKTVKYGSTKLGTGSFAAKDITNKGSTYTWSGNCYCRVGWYDGGGNYHESNGTASYSSGTISFTSPFRTITYNANGGSGAPAEKTVLYNISSKLSGTIPTRTGFTFLGWSKSATATTATYYSGDSITITSNTTLYAVWKANSYALTVSHPTTAAVTILKNGDVYTGTSVDYGDVLTVSFTPSSGYVIDTATLNGNAISSGDTHTVAGDVTISVATVAGYSTIATYDSVVETLGTFSLTVNQYNPAHYCKVKYYDSNDVLLATSAAFTTSTSLTIPRNWFSNFPSDTALTITAELTTYTDSSCTTQTGSTDSRTFTVNADSSMKPTLSAGCISLSAYNTGTGAANLTSPGYVKGFSKVQAVFDESHITHASGASTAAYSITVQNVTTSDNPPNTTLLSGNVLTLSGSLQVTYKVTDTRGRSATGTETISVNDYFAPSVSAVCKRTDSVGNEDDSGTYMTITPTAAITALADNAVTSLTLHCKVAGGSYVSYGEINDGATTLFGSGTFSPDASYVVKVTVTDKVGNSSYIEISMPKRSWEFHIGRVNGESGAAFGKVTEYAKALQLAPGWELMLDDVSLTKTALVYLLGIIAGTNLKTVNSNSLLGSGNVEVQDTLVSGTNIKSVNGNSLLGSGDVSLSDFLVVEQKTKDNISVSSQSYTEDSFSIAKAGYTPVGLVGWTLGNATSSGQNRTKSFLFKCYISGTTLYYGIGTYGTASAKVKLFVDVLYRKN